MESRKTNWTNNNAPVGKQNCRTKTNKSIGFAVFNELKTFHRFSRLLNTFTGGGLNTNNTTNILIRLYNMDEWKI